MTQGEIIYLAIVLVTFIGFAAGVGSVSRQQTRQDLLAGRRPADGAHPTIGVEA